MMELPRRYSTPMEGGAGSHPLIVQTMVGVHELDLDQMTYQSSGSLSGPVG